MHIIPIELSIELCTFILITHSEEIVSNRVIANQKQYQAYCLKLHGRRDDASDLFQDFFLKIITVHPDKVTRAYCYRTIYNMFCNSRRARPDTTQLRDLPGGNGFNEDKLQARAVEDYIRMKMETSHNFLEIAIFDQAQSESLRSMERKTTIPIKSLSRYYHSARAELKSVAENNLYI